MGERVSWASNNKEKDDLRYSIWNALIEKNFAVDDPFGGISNFTGCEVAAYNLASLQIWRDAKVVKCNPDTPQIPVRFRALQDGKTLYMAVPRLSDERCFVELEKNDLKSRGVSLEYASTWQGAVEHGKKVYFEDMKKIDICVTGCVAVTLEGGRTGKGAGFADLEFGLLRIYNLIDNSTPIIATVHDIMLVDNDKLPIQSHDTFLTCIVTPTRIIHMKTDLEQPQGIEWDLVEEAQYEAIPILKKLKPKK